MKKKVLVIDDELDICLLLTTILKNMDYETDYAIRLQEGIKKSDSFHPDIIFLDLNLPDGSGFSAIPVIKEKSPETRIIIISAYDGAKERKKAFDEGVDYFIGKPFNQKSITAALDEVTRQPKS